MDDFQEVVMKGKHVFRVVFGVCLATGLTACGIGGMWMNGNPNATSHLVPPGHDWSKPDAGASARDTDWQACGGQRSGNISPDRQGATGKETADLSRDKLYAAQRCMLGKGYRYTGTCEGDIPSRYPACQSSSR
ncbi:hypothetical protein ACYX79_14370 [Stenotrophomonas rhizophila]|uniref:Lipoprotein n=1 Tax=Stenotrophomonas rhizophila TaxID=216778 RepID=A0AAW5PKB6_9GAMM|nr:hypothetical protein [Stenotrophomonas rhizophila]MCS4280918.1 hypothetical protein [Stenotrophomonas rhizophila]